MEADPNPLLRVLANTSNSVTHTSNATHQPKPGGSLRFFHAGFSTKFANWRERYGWRLILIPSYEYWLTPLIEPFTNIMPSTSQSPDPPVFFMHQGLFTSFPIGGHSSTLPSLTFDSSSHNSIPPSMVPRALHQGRTPTVASSSQPTGPVTEASQAGGRAVYGPDGDILVHKNPGGEWSVGSGSWDMQTHYDQSYS